MIRSDSVITICYGSYMAHKCINPLKGPTAELSISDAFRRRHPRGDAQRRTLQMANEKQKHPHRQALLTSHRPAANPPSTSVCFCLEVGDTAFGENGRLDARAVVCSRGDFRKHCHVSQETVHSRVLNGRGGQERRSEGTGWSSFSLPPSTPRLTPAGRLLLTPMS